MTCGQTDQRTAAIPPQGIYCGSEQAAETVAEAMREASGQVKPPPTEAQLARVCERLGNLQVALQDLSDRAVAWRGSTLDLGFAVQIETTRFYGLVYSVQKELGG